MKLHESKSGWERVEFPTGETRCIVNAMIHAYQQMVDNHSKDIKALTMLASMFVSARSSLNNSNQYWSLSKNQWLYLQGILFNEGVYQRMNLRKIIHWPPHWVPL